MQKIMKMDMDDFFENHLDHYDQAVARWTDCSFKEWFDGAEGRSFTHLRVPFSLSFLISLLNDMFSLTELTNKFTECLNSVSPFPF